MGAGASSQITPGMKKRAKKNKRSAAKDEQAEYEAQIKKTIAEKFDGDGTVSRVGTRLFLYGLWYLYFLSLWPFHGGDAKPCSKLFSSFHSPGSLALFSLSVHWLLVR